MKWRYLPSKRKKQREKLKFDLKRKKETRLALERRPWWEVRKIYGSEPIV